jgi:hypothetical protein
MSGIKKGRQGVIEAGYVPIEELEAADLATCGDGLFQSMRSHPFRNVIVTTVGGTRYAIYLDDPQGPMFAPSPAGAGSRRTGILWPRPSIEVDPTSQYDAEVEYPAVGDLILAPNPAIVARTTDGWKDAEQMPLWHSVSATGKPIGFRRWQVVSVREQNRRPIYTRPASDENGG